MFITQVKYNTFTFKYNLYLGLAIIPKTVTSTIKRNKAREKRLYLEIEGEETEIILLLAGGVVGHILYHNLHCVYVRVHLNSFYIEVKFFMHYNIR